MDSVFLFILDEQVGEYYFHAKFSSRQTIPEDLLTFNKYMIVQGFILEQGQGSEYDD